MENFIVSARKYRPQTFDTVVGQASITTTLKNAIRNNQVAQAFLFCGPRGVGKTTCARILAKTINCENLSPAIEPCDKCVSCKSFNENSSFNIHELDGASNNSVDDIRSLIDTVRIPPQMGKYKVYIIDEVHMLSPSAFNAFLKTLEEPPEYVKFILATTEKHKILPTILSRCQIFDFKRITVDDIVHYLQFVASSEHIEAEENALHIIAQKADGAMRDALSIFDQLVSFSGNSVTYKNVLENLNVLDYEYYFRITQDILEGNIPNTLLIIHDILEKGFDGQHFLIGFGEHLRNLLVCKDPSTARLLETAPDIRTKYLEQAGLCPSGFLLQVLDISNRCDLNYKASNNKRLHLELALMQMCTLLSQPEPRPSGVNPARPAPKAASPAPEKKNTLTDSPAAAPKEKQETLRFSDLKKSSKSGTISIKGEPEPARTEKSDEGSVVSETRESYSPTDDFTVDALFEAWDVFAESLKIDFPHVYTNLRKYKPTLKEGYLIEFPIENRIIEEALRQKQNELSTFLRNKLNNGKINVSFTVLETIVEQKPYTDKEKFNRMAEKNPALLKLKDELDLELE